jgi:hypothetical protein
MAKRAKEGRVSIKKGEGPFNSGRRPHRGATPSGLSLAATSLPVAVLFTKCWVSKDRELLIL